MARRMYIFDRPDLSVEVLKDRLIVDISRDGNLVAEFGVERQVMS